MFTKKKIWFVSHPSGSAAHTPVFFSAINDFAASQEGIEIVFPHQEAEETHLTQAQIAKADLVLVEVSIPSTGSGIELGWANALGKEVVAFHQGGSQPSPAIKFVAKQIHVYVTREDIINTLDSL